MQITSSSLPLPVDHTFTTLTMALARIKNRLTVSSVPAPPSSPVPTSARGNRNEQAFGTYLDKMKHMPDSLPDYVNRSMIADVEYRLIKIMDKNSIREMMRSITKYGVFRISGHGISTAELHQAFAEADFCFGLLADRWSRDGDREEFQWSRSAMTGAERRRDVAREDRFRKFSQKMENLASKLEAIADAAAKIVGSHGTRQTRQKIIENETRMTLFKHNNSALQPHTPRSTQTPRVEAKKDSSVFALSLHIPTEQCDFCLLSDEGPLLFRTGPDTIVFTLGEQLQEWSCGEFNVSKGEINIEPEMQDDHEQGSYSVELRCSPSILNQAVDRINTITITDQVFGLLSILLLFSLLSFLFF